MFDKPTPPGWPRISSAVFYEDPNAAIEWLCDVFGFEIRLKVDGEGGRVEHCELDVGNDGLLMVGTAGAQARDNRSFAGSPRSLDGKNTQSLAVFVDDADAHCERARKAGAEIVMEPETHDYGENHWADRTYEVVDPEGHHWWFMQRMRG
jgi:uncharacterized glyoxalase superfamily protein PhnB